jgi:hypothetical protein
MGRRKWIWIAPLAIVAMAVFVAIGGELVRLLWNWLLPPLFGFQTINFRQGLALLVLCRILFGGWGVHGRGNSGVRGRVAERMAARWERMTPEERQQFRDAVRRRCGFEPPGESTGQ